MYKAPLTASVFKDFSSFYDQISSSELPVSLNSNEPFVYVDATGMKVITSVVNTGQSAKGIFALSVAQDGWMEMLAIDEAS